MHSYKKYFSDAFSAIYPGQAGLLLSQTDDHFQRIAKDIEFASTSTNPIDKRLGFSAYFLAFIQTLDEQGESFERIREICLKVVLAYIRPKNKIQELLKLLPVKLANTQLARIFLKAFHKKVSRRAHKDGFVASIITGKEETFGLGYGFDILECGICKLFKKHNCEKYASILCEVDEITSNLAGLKLVRSGTIALGAKKCDFRFKKEPSIKRG